MSLSATEPERIHLRSVLPACVQLFSVSIAGGDAIFELETATGECVELPIALDALPDFALGIAAVLHAAERGTAANSQDLRGVE